jgi:hypothetical protein
MSVVNTATVPRGLVPGLKAIYGFEYSQYEAQYSKIFSQETSSKNFEDIMSLAGTGLMIVKNEGDQLSSDNLAQGYVSRLIHANYGKVVMLTEEVMQDFQYSPKLQDTLGKNFAMSVQHTKEIVAHNVLNNGFSTVSGNMYNNADGKALLASDHPLIKGGTSSNILAVAAPLSSASIEQLCIQIRQVTNDAGLRINLKPKKLIIPVQLMFNADRIVNSSLESGTANNDKNVISGLGLEVVASPYLSSSTAFFISTDADNGLMMLNRKEVKMDADEDFMTKNGRFSVGVRFSVGYGDFRCIYGTAGA